MLIVRDMNCVCTGKNNCQEIPKICSYIKAILAFRVTQCLNAGEKSRKNLSKCLLLTHGGQHIKTFMPKI